jgi:hypothetical protein
MEILRPCGCNIAEEAHLNWCLWVHLLNFNPDLPRIGLTCLEHKKWKSSVRNRGTNPTIVTGSPALRAIANASTSFCGSGIRKRRVRGPNLFTCSTTKGGRYRMP